MFIAHFGWPRERVSRGMRYYLMSIGLIVPLIMALMMFDNLDDREFSGSLGRLCFILICGALAVVTLSLKKAEIPTVSQQRGQRRQHYQPYAVEHDDWRATGCHSASAVGYLAAARALLAGLKPRLPSGSLLLVVYHVIRRWMLINAAGWRLTGRSIAGQRC